MDAVERSYPKNWYHFQRVWLILIDIWIDLSTYIETNLPGLDVSGSVHWRADFTVNPDDSFFLCDDTHWIDAQIVWKEMLDIKQKGEKDTYWIPRNDRKVNYEKMY